jgi:glycosyltransferase involved in cell wall biosynthesis
MTTPKISIVMPSLNQDQYLEAAILSVLEQDYPATELIVIDGGSTDESVNILEKYADRIAYFTSEKDSGQSEALNKGFKRATGEIIGWLNSDDTYQPGTLWQVAAVFSEPHVKVAMCSRFGLMDADGTVFDYKENTFTSHKKLIRYWSTGGMTVNQPSVFFRRELIANLDSVLDPSLHYAMDYDLWLRLSRQHDIHVVDGHWANYRFHDESKSGRGFDDFASEWYAVSRRYWGIMGSASWWGHWLNRQLWRNYLRLRYGLPGRLRGMFDG